MSEHTPWSVSCTRRTMDGQGWYRVVGDEGRREIAYVPFGDRTQAEYVECTKHARLLAAAPDVLGALLAVKEFDDFMPALPRAVLAKIDKAIAKATGQ